jgi:hypothetical protein
MGVTMTQESATNNAYESIDEKESEQKSDPITEKIDLILIKIAHKKSNKKLDSVLTKTKSKSKK